MNRNKLLLSVVLVFSVGLSFVPLVDAKMYREVCIGVSSDAPNEAEADRHYMQEHSQGVVTISGPWMSRYQVWLPYDPPEEAVERFGAMKGRYAELWYTEENYFDRPALRAGRFPDWTGMNNKNLDASPADEIQKNGMFPANPTETFYDANPHPYDTSIVRWISFIRYPEGVSEEEGEKWFLETHAREAVKQPGLLKFVSYRAWEIPNESAEDMPADVPARRSWVRMCEYWYTDLDAWREANIESPPEYTAPSWGGEYPFVEMISTFIPYYHYYDFLNKTYNLDYERPKVIYDINTP